MFTRTVLSSHGDESKTLRDLLEKDIDEEVDFVSDTDFFGPNGSPFVTITGENDTRRNLNPQLDGQQQRIVDRKEGAKCR